MTNQLFFDTDCLAAFLWTENEGNVIWAEMLAANRWIGASSFSEYLKKPYKPLNHY